MGVMRLFSNDAAEGWSGSMTMNSGSAVGPASQPPEPNPKRFEIVQIQEVNGWTVAVIHYPGCTTYEGKKCLVFDCKIEVVKQQSIIDPHFLEREDRLSPIARFEPTDRGVFLAVQFCKKMR